MISQMEEEISTDKPSQHIYNQDNYDQLSTNENSTASKQNNNLDGSNGFGSSNSLTYYYSSFDLFENEQNAAFLKYRRFIKKLQHYLGPDWVIYANQVCYKEDLQGKKYFLDSQYIFEASLEIWLQMRRQFHKERKNSISEEKVVRKESEMSVEDGQQQQQQQEQQQQNQQVQEEAEQSRLQEINFSMFEENEMFEEFSKKFSSFFADFKMESMTYKAVLHGFFLSAIETWNYILRNPVKKRNRSDSFKQVIDDYKKKIIKPIMVVSQKITGYFGSQKQDQTMNKISELSESQFRSFSNFQKNIHNEEELLLEKMKQLTIAEDKLSEQQEQQQQQQPQEVTLKKISEKALNGAVVKFAQNYLQNIVNNTNKQWQVARGFVTNIIELKYNNIQEYANNMKIRFLQPAQEFYNQLMETYILFKSNNYTNIQFKDFLEKTKQNLGNKWSENLIIPTQVFFQTLIFQWNQILEENKNSNNDDETIIRLFVQRVRNKMADSWDENIVQKAQENIQE
ncbi:hypothetical protein ABPG72_018510 [Tetrahymena utriculariae]